jgi:hypothetical protein
VLVGGRGEGTEALASAPGVEEGKAVVEEGDGQSGGIAGRVDELALEHAYARSGSSSQTAWLSTKGTNG